MLHKQIISYFECNDVLIPNLGIFERPKNLDYTAVGFELEYFVVLGYVGEEPVYLVVKTDSKSITKVVQIEPVDIPSYESGFFDLFGYCDKNQNILPNVLPPTKLESQFSEAAQELLDAIKAERGKNPVSQNIAKALGKLDVALHGFKTGRVN